MKYVELVMNILTYLFNRVNVLKSFFLFLIKIVSILSNDIISGVEGGFDSLDTASLPTGKTCMHTHTYKILINLGIN